MNGISEIILKFLLDLQQKNIWQVIKLNLLIIINIKVILCKFHNGTSFSLQKKINYCVTIESDFLHHFESYL